MAHSLSGPVFMSYSRRDEAFMRRIANFLRNQGIQVWVDNEKLIPGTPVWEEEIEKAIKASAAVVAVMSPDSKNSEWVRREISLSDQYRKRIFPVLVRGDEDSSITLRLITRQYVDIRENEEIGMKSLSAALLFYLGEPEAQVRKVREETERIAALGEERFAREKSETEREAVEREAGRLKGAYETTDETEDKSVVSSHLSELSELTQQTETDKITLTPKWSSVFWATLGWAIGGAIGGFMYSEYGEIPGGAIGGAIGGLVTLTALRFEKVLSNQKNMIWISLAWAIGGAIGWFIGWGLTEAVGAGIGMAIFSIIGMASTLSMDYIRSNWKTIAGIALAWAIGGAIGWSIAKGLIDGLFIDYATGWAIGTAIGWAIGGFVMSWQIMKR